MAHSTLLHLKWPRACARTTWNPPACTLGRPGHNQALCNKCAGLILWSRHKRVLTRFCVQKRVRTWSTANARGAAPHKPVPHLRAPKRRLRSRHLRKLLLRIGSGSFGGGGARVSSVVRPLENHRPIFWPKHLNAPGQRRQVDLRPNNTSKFGLTPRRSMCSTPRMRIQRGACV